MLQFKNVIKILNLNLKAYLMDNKILQETFVETVEGVYQKYSVEVKPEVKEKIVDDMMKEVDLSSTGPRCLK